jgi:hypothetical protein
VIETCLKHGLRNVELVLQFNDDAPDSMDLGLRLFDYGPMLRV